MRAVPVVVLDMSTQVATSCTRRRYKYTVGYTCHSSSNRPAQLTRLGQKEHAITRPSCPCPHRGGSFQEASSQGQSVVVLSCQLARSETRIEEQIFKFHAPSIKFDVYSFHLSGYIIHSKSVNLVEKEKLKQTADRCLPRPMESKSTFIPRAPTNMSIMRTETPSCLLVHGIVEGENDYEFGLLPFHEMQRGFNVYSHQYRVFLHTVSPH